MENNTSLEKFIELNSDFLDKTTLMSNHEWQSHAEELAKQGMLADAVEINEILENDSEAPYFMTDEYDNLSPIYCYEDIIDIYSKEDFKLPEPEAEISL